MRYEPILKKDKNNKMVVYLKLSCSIFGEDIKIVKKMPQFSDTVALEKALTKRKELLDAFDIFIDDCIIKRLSPKTISDYLLFNVFFLFRDGVEKIADVNKFTMRAYMLDVTRRGLSDASVASYIRHVKVFISWLEKKSYIEEPFSEELIMPETPKKAIKVFSNNDIREVFFKLEDHYSNNEFLRKRNCLIVALMLDAGLRRSEVIRINKDDIAQKDDRFLLLIKGKGKKERILALGKTTSKYAKEYLEIEGKVFNATWLFSTQHGKRIAASTIDSLYHTLSSVTCKKLNSHQLRHNFATNYCLDALYENAEPDIYTLMALLGHSEFETTNRYLHIAKKYLSATTRYSHLDRMEDAMPNNGLDIRKVFADNASV